MLDPQDKTWRKQVKEVLAGKGVDLAVDNIGGTLLPEVIETLGYGGRVSLVGTRRGRTPHPVEISSPCRRPRTLCCSLLHHNAVFLIHNEDYLLTGLLLQRERFVAKRIPPLNSHVPVCAATRPATETTLRREKACMV